jgi:hypothetical protein
VFNDGGTNCLSNNISRQGDLWYPIAIRVRQPENFELDHIDIEVGGSIIQRFDTYFFVNRSDLVSHTDNQCVIRFPVKEYQLDRIYNIISADLHEFRVKFYFKGGC